MLKYQKCDMCPSCIGVNGKKVLLYRVCTMCYVFSVPKKMRNMVTAHEVVAQPPKTPKTRKAPTGRQAPGSQAVKKPRAAPRKRKIEDGTEEAPAVAKKRKPRAPKSEGSSSAKTSPENSVDEKPAKPKRARVPRANSVRESAPKVPQAKPQASIPSDE